MAKSDSGTITGVLPEAGLRRVASLVDIFVGRWIERLVAVLVIIETVVLFAGVVSRYVFHRPITWSDEFASILFLWLAMLGAVVAYRRLEHMRMGALVANLSIRGRQLTDMLSLLAGMAFMLAVLPPAIEHTIDEIVVMTPALEVPNSWRAMAVPVGLGLMLLFGALRLIQQFHWRAAILALGIIVGFAIVLMAAKPLLMAMGNYRLIVFFVVLVGAAVLAGIPIAFVFGIGTYAYLVISTRTPLTVVVSRMDEGMSHIILLSVPLFVFLGLVIEITGMAKAMVGFLSALIGHARGGLQYVLVGAMYLVSGISGSKAADMAAVAPILFPEMEKRGARRGGLVALLSATGAQTETIPPSLVLITIGSVTGVSIAALFTGGLLPGVVLAAMLCAVLWWQYRHEDLSHVRRATGQEIGRALVIALPSLVLPFVIRASVVEGVATATEVSTIGLAYSLAYGIVAAVLFKQRIEWSRLWPALIDTASLSGAILLIIGTATGMAWALTQSGFSRDLVRIMTTLPGGGAAFMAASVVAFIILGSVLEGIPAIVLFGPLLFPVARAVGIHEVHYAMVVILAMGMGLFAPPFGVGYYTACAIGRLDPADALRPIGPYMLALFVGLIVVALVPWISIGFL